MAIIVKYSKYKKNNFFQYIAILAIIISTNLYAFGVDVCFLAPAANRSTITNCIDVDKSCRTSNLSKKESLVCRIKAISRSISGLAGIRKIQGGRSLLHSDATYLIAQYIGFSPWQAYQMMIYSEATDQASYVPFDENGQQVLSNDLIKACIEHWGYDMPSQCLIITPELNGISKFNYTTGGMLLHLHAGYSQNSTSIPLTDYPTSYFSPKNKPYEILLDNFRAWTFDERKDACAAGITNDLNIDKRTTSPCKVDTATLKSPMNLFSLGISRLAIPFTTKLGTLIIEDYDNNNPNTTNVLATNESLQKYISPHDVNFAKMGIFLHALADRYSHHMCTDRSYFYQTSDSYYTSKYSSVYCAQGNHFLWHVWEQGTNQSDANLATEHQTMRPALNAVYDQLLDYARHKGIPINSKINKEKMLDELISVLEVFDPKERLNSMVELMEKHKVLPLPRHGSMAQESIDKWLKQAGAPVNNYREKI